MSLLKPSSSLGVSSGTRSRQSSGRKPTTRLTPPIVVRGSRSTLIGVGAALIVLAALVAALGPALSVVPIETLRLIVGALLLAFGLQWLRKAILRSSGYTPLHDEDAAFRRHREEAAKAGRDERAGLDWYSFTVAFKGVRSEEH